MKMFRTSLAAFFLSHSVLLGAVNVVEQSMGSLSGNISGSGMQMEEFVGLPWVANSFTGSQRETVAFPANGYVSALVRIPCYLQLDKNPIQPSGDVAIGLYVDFSETNLLLGGYAGLLSWDTTYIKYDSIISASSGAFIEPQINEDLTTSGQLVFSEVKAEGDSGLINLLTIFLSGSGQKLEDSIVCPLNMKFIALNSAHTFQNLLSQVDVSPANLVIKSIILDTIPPVISEVESIDYTSDTQGPYEVTASVEDPILKDVLLYYRSSGSSSYNKTSMGEVEDHFSGSIPGYPAGTRVEYYVEAQDTMGNVSRSPEDYDTAPYFFEVIQTVQPYLDANGDGGLDILDVVWFLLRARTNPKDPRLDWDNNGRFTIDDAALMLAEIYKRNISQGSVLLASFDLNQVPEFDSLTEDERTYLDDMIDRMELSADLEAQFKGVLEPDIIELPKVFSLNQNAPNPFNPSTAISYNVPEGKSVFVSLIICDLRGKVIRTLISKRQIAGSYKVVWNGTDDYGKDVSSGVYFYRMRASDFVQTRKMVLLK